MLLMLLRPGVGDVARPEVDPAAPWTIVDATSRAIADYEKRFQGMDIYSTVKDYLRAVSNPSKLNIGMATYGGTFGGVASTDVLSPSKG
jgi:GH18 family chitinase